jgi:hypothetical protein
MGKIIYEIHFSSLNKESIKNTLKSYLPHITHLVYKYVRQLMIFTLDDIFICEAVNRSLRFCRHCSVCDFVEAIPKETTHMEDQFKFYLFLL